MPAKYTVVSGARELLQESRIWKCLVFMCRTGQPVIGPLMW